MNVNDMHYVTSLR